MKITIYKLTHLILMYLSVAMTISFHQTAAAQYKVVGVPKTCPLCNPPQEITEIRGKNYNLHEFPAMHLYEGQSSTSEYKFYRPPNLMQLYYKDTTRPLYDESISRFGEQYMFNPESMYVRVVSQSAPNTLISTNVVTSTSKNVYVPWNLLFLDVTAGAPGDTAVAWLVAGGTKELVIDGYRTGINSKMTFIQPVVVHPTPLPLFIEEIVINDDNRLSSNFFSLKNQKQGEKVTIASQTCKTIYSRAPYGGDYVLKNPHYLERESRQSCADLLNVYDLRRNETTDESEWVPIKRILLLVHYNFEENLTKYYNGHMIFNGIEQIRPR